MILEEDLDAAVEAGVIDRAQAIRIAHLARLRLASSPASPGAESPSRPDPDDERFRLIGGFNDVFVTIGVGLLAAAVLGLSSVLGFGQVFALTSLLVSWGLAEWFSRRMRLALPSIALALMFAASGGFLGVVAIGLVAGDGFSGARADAWGYLGAGLGTVLAAALHHWRFRVPIDGAIGGLGGLAIAAGLIERASPGFVGGHLYPLALAAGLAIFLAAMRLDLSDPLRRTRRSDVAFWLHLLAAPLIVHPVTQAAIGDVGRMGTAAAGATLAVFALLALVALVIDRRALIVSGLSYAGIAVAHLISRGVSGDLHLPLTLLGLAVVVLALSAGWRSLRRLLLPRVPLGGLRAKLPPAEPA